MLFNSYVFIFLFLFAFIISQSRRGISLFPILNFKWFDLVDDASIYTTICKAEANYSI